MAEVFVARRRYTADIEKPVVLKRIRQELSQNPAFADLFLQEARIALRLNHPNVVQVYDFGEWEGRLFLAMERVDGWDLGRLRQTLHRRRQLLPVPLAFYLAWSVCRALDYAHNLADGDGKPWGLVHQDVGHPNILIGRDGAVKLTDFGVARLQNEGPERLRGRPGYMSPEQLRGEPVDQRSDLYSLGVVLFELLTDQRLFGGGDAAQTLWRSLHHPVPPVSSLRPELKTEVDSLLQSMLQRDRDQRAPGARVLLPELRRRMEPLDPETAAEALGTLLRELEADEVALGEEEQTVLQSDEATDLFVPPAAVGSLEPGAAAALPAPDGDAFTAVTDVAAAPPPPAPSRTVAVIRSVVRARWVVPPDSSESAASPQEKTVSARMVQPRRERREALVVVLLSLLLIGGLLSAWWVLRPDASPPSSRPTPPVVAAPPAPPTRPEPLIVRSLPEEGSTAPIRTPPTAPAAPESAPAAPAPVAAPPPAPEPPPPAVATPVEVVITTGTVDIRVREGWGKVRIDGKPWKGATPLMGVELPAGRHLIQVEIPSTGRVYSRELLLEAGQRQVVELGP